MRLCSSTTTSLTVVEPESMPMWTGPHWAPEGDAGHAVGHMPGVERLVLLPAGKEGRLAGIGGGGGVAVQGRGHLGQAERLVGVEGRAQRHVQQAVLGALAGDPQ